MTAVADAGPAGPVLSRDPFAAVLELAAVQAFANHVNGVVEELRGQAPDVLPRKFSSPVLSPLDPTVELAGITMTNPKKTAKVTDAAAFADWMATEHPDECVVDEQLVGSTPAVIAALRRYAPAEVFDELVAATQMPAEWATSNVLKRSAAAGQPVGPGGEMDDHAPPGITVSRPDSKPQIRLADDALTHVVAAWRAGKMDLPLALPDRGE